MNQQFTVCFKIPQAILTCLVFLLFIKISYSQKPGNASLHAPAAPIVLTVTGTTAQAGIFSIAKLDWNPVDPLTAGDFYVERLENLVWKTLDTIRYTTGLANYTYNDIISSPFCLGDPSPDYNITYRISFSSDDGLNNATSNTATEGPFADMTFPLDVLNDTVSVFIDPSGTFTGRPVIGWLASPSNDVAEYIVQRYITIPNPSYVDIATLPVDKTYFVDTDPAVNPCEQRYSYAVVTIDKCGKRSPGTYDIPETQTISLTLPEISPCERKANLSWTAYYTMPGSLGGYKVYRTDNLGAPVEVYDTQNPSILSYTDNYNFISDHIYTYYVRAYSSNGLYSSTSCQKQSIYRGQSMPDSLYIMQASVEGDSCVKLDYFFKPINTVKKLHLERRDTIGGNWQVIDSIVAPTGPGNFLDPYGSFRDTTARVHSQSYTYRLVVIDDCQAPALYSFNTATTILLQQAFSATDNVLVWNFYDTWLKGVKNYKIYRFIDGQPPGGTLVDSVSAATGSFSEPTSLFNPKAQVCYWVEAYENAGNPYTSPLVIFSKSNMGCIIKDPSLFMPNAFKPESDKNNRLRPVYTYIDPSTFQIIVFDRWGQEIFETNDINGWDGRINGQIASPGLYSYLLTYKSFDGKDFIKRGTATLIR